MAWEKLIRSGSNAHLNQVTASFFSGNGANVTGVVSSSYALSASWAPGDSGGNGIYGGSGTIPTNVTATLTDNFNITVPIGAAFYVNGDANQALYIDNEQTIIRGLRSGDEHFILQLRGDVYSASFYDPSPTPNGIQYLDNYGTTIKNNDRSIPDVGTIRNHLTASYALSASWSPSSGGADGNGIYDGSGTIASSTVATVTDSFAINIPIGATFRVDGDDGSPITITNNSTQILSLNNGAEYHGVYLNGTSGTASFFNPSGLGLMYGIDYSSTLKNNLRTIPDVGTIRNHLTASYAISASYAPPQVSVSCSYALTASYVDGVPSYISNTASLDFGFSASFEGDFASSLISNSLITNSNFRSFGYLPLTSSHHDIDDFLVERLTFGVRNIIDNTSFEIFSFPASTTWGMYTIKYNITIG